MPKISNILSLIFVLIITLFLTSCSSKKLTAEECVSAFINAAEQHDMSKAWNVLSPEAQSYYNDLGEKNRKSGKGILEHDISEITSFKNGASDYKIEISQDDPSKILIRTQSNIIYEIKTIETNGDYRIKDIESIKNVIKGIAVGLNKKDYY